MTEGASEFVLSEQVDGEIRRAAQMLLRARHVLALTGAGLSVESGIPPFRGPGGLWTKYGEPPLDGYQRFLRDPRKAWEERLNPTEAWSRGLRETLAKAKPNTGHQALAALEDTGLLHSLITQNIDDLHGQAGSRELIEIHGNASLLRCIECVARFRRDGFEIDPANLPPHCPECGGVVKEDTVHFGEPIPADVLRRCTQAVERSDCILVIGTSATVYPAAEFPLEVKRRGGTLIEVNPHESELTPIAHLSLRGPGGAVLSRMLHWSTIARKEADTT
ncbi:MAG: Sir2 family NAD-dependent protein deacetylase [Myxococcota bacterium]